MLLGYGLAMMLSIHHSNMVAVTIIVVLVILPVIFIDAPLRTDGVTIIVAICCIVTTKYYK